MPKNVINIFTLLFLLVLQTSFIPELTADTFILNLVFTGLFITLLNTYDFHKVLVYSLLIGLFLDTSYFLPLGTTPLLLSTAIVICDKMKFKRSTILLTFALICFAYSVLVNGFAHIYVDLLSTLFCVTGAYLSSSPKQRQLL